MESIIKEIEKYVEDNEFKIVWTSSVSISEAIARFAHRNQKRENGEDYVNHPLRMLENYRFLVGIDIGVFDYDLCWENKIPFEGVQEVCLLHDVLEDTDITLDQIEQIFNECNLGLYFSTWIKGPLQSITHDKNVGYLEYIKDVSQDYIASFVKMLDLTDNLKLTDLVKIDYNVINRCHRYVDYYFLLNSIYNFNQHIDNYVDDVAKTIQNNQKE